MINRKRKPFSWVALGALVVLLSVSACTTHSPKISKLVKQMGKEMVADPELPGLSVAILKEGETDPLCMAFGTASVENNVPMTTDSVIKIGSVTKVFTATLTHKLIEEGKLSYDTTIDQFFPDFPEGNKIKIRHLLDHTSGIMDMLHLEAVYSNMSKCWKPEELITMVAAQPLDFQPGTDQKYCNTGYLMLAMICEKVTGKSYDAQIQELFCGDLDMNLVLCGSDSAIVPNISSGYTSDEQSKLSLPMMASIAIAHGTGNLESRPKDVVRLVNLGNVLENNVFDTLKPEPMVLENGKVAEYVANNGGWTNKQGYLDGCTLFEFSDPDITVLGKLGSFPGFGTVYFYDQRSKYAVVLSVNNERKITDAMLMGAKLLYALRNDGSSSY